MLKAAFETAMVCLVVVALAFPRATQAEQTRFPITLPHCPTPLLLSAPIVFAGAENQQHILDHLAANSARKGTYVLALSAPNNPDLYLLVLELGTTTAVQGNVSQKYFNELRAYVTRHDPGTLAEGKAYAEALAKGARIPTTIKGTNFYSVSDNAQAITLLALGRGLALGKDMTSFNATKIVYAHRCIVQVNILAPVSTMSIQEFEALVPHLAVQ